MPNMSSISLCVLFIMIAFCPSYREASNILVVAPFFGVAHKTIMETISLELASRGHDVTMITRNIIEDPPKNYKQIRVEKNEELENMDASHIPEVTPFKQMWLMWVTTLSAFDVIISSPEVKNFTENDISKFDLVICELFYQELNYMFAYKYKAPLVLVDTTTFFSHMGGFMGNPLPLNYAQHEAFKGMDIRTIPGMLINALLTIFDRIGRKYYYIPESNKFFEKYFKNLSEPVPGIEDLQNNVSLILMNSHHSFDTVIPLVPGIVQVGGLHIKTPKALPKNLQKFMDDAEHGVIYLSFGSHWRTKYLGNRTSNLLEVFKRLKQRVVWKTDSDIETPENVLISSWLPQNDILAHPNVKVFISHCGILSTQEAVHYGVPILGIPLFWDQYGNSYKLKKLGVSVEVDYLTLTEHILYDSLKEILDNPSYSENMRTISARFNDRINNPLDTAVYWIEYVIRHKGSEFLKSPMAQMSFVEYYFIELFLMASAVFLVLIGIVILITLCRACHLRDVIEHSKKTN